MTEKNNSACFPEKNGNKVTHQEMYVCLSGLEEKIDRHHKEVVDLLNKRIDDISDNTNVVSNDLKIHASNDRKTTAIIGAIAVFLPLVLNFYSYVPKIIGFLTKL